MGGVKGYKDGNDERHATRGQIGRGGSHIVTSTERLTINASAFLYAGGRGANTGGGEAAWDGNDRDRQVKVLRNQKQGRRPTL